MKVEPLAVVALLQAVMIPTFLVTLIMKLRLLRLAGKKLTWRQWMKSSVQNELPPELRKRYSVLDLISNSSFLCIMSLVLYYDFKIR
jgi:hypothetical protein